VHRLGRKGLAAIAGSALGIALWAAPAALGNDGGIVSHELNQTPSQVRSYWTPARMKAAEPLDQAASTGGGEPVARTSALSSDQEIPEAFDVTYPYRIHGRMFMTFGATDASCSATVVTSSTRDVVMTAGHCVAEPVGGGNSRFAANVLFVPGYRNGNAPLGSYVGTRGATPGLWAALGVISQDVGFVNLAPLNGVPVQDQLGSRGISFNRSPRALRGKSFQLFGYPAAPPGIYDGERPIICYSGFRGIEAFSGAVLVSPCHQQEGASGGGWVIGAGLLVSLTSHSGCNNPSPACDVISGTYLGNAALQVWAGAGGGLTKGRKKRIKRCKKFKGKKHDNCLTRAETFQPVVR
jgi:hypothetical protein